MGKNNSIEVESGGIVISSVASGLARLCLEKTLEQGGVIEIPSLGIKFDKNGPVTEEGVDEVEEKASE